MSEQASTSKGIATRYATAVFGLADEYGYQPSLKLLQAQLPKAPALLLIENGGHLSHHFARKEVLCSIEELIKTVCS